MIMADYRRLISYIYEYEGKQKGKNVGFAKLEARNGQCRINVNVKRIYMGGNAIGVYLLGTGGRETFLGNVFVRGGNGEFRANVDTKNVEGTGTGLDTYFGLSVHDVKNSWRCYKTIWEDALAAEEGNTAEIYCGDVAGSRKRDDTAGSLKSSERDRGRDRQRGGTPGTGGKDCACGGAAG